MLLCEGYTDTQVYVLGLGKSGLAAARALVRSGARVTVWDDQEESRAKAKLEGLRVREYDRINWGHMTALVISPGIPHTFPKPHPAAKLAKDSGVPIIGDIELLATSGAAAPQIAITGTNGKSTTTALLGHIVESTGRQVEIGGNLGPPISDMTMLEQDGVYVLELSSYQLELCPTARFKISVLLNVTPDHLDRHGGMSGYIQAKKNIFHSQGSGDTAIICIDDDVTAEIYADIQNRSGLKIIPISSKTTLPNGIYVKDGKLIDDLDGQKKFIMNLNNLANLPGLHNAQNIVAAYAVARTLKIVSDQIVEAIQSFPGLAHRQEIIEYFDGITFVNDSKATNGEATAKALACYENIYWIAGGKAKETGLEGLAEFLPRIRKAFLIGDAAESFAKVLDGKVAFEISGDLETATHHAREMAVQDGLKNAVVLLSPACASFDQFANFEARGDAFRMTVDRMRLDHSGGTVHVQIGNSEARL